MLIQLNLFYIEILILFLIFFIQSQQFNNSRNAQSIRLEQRRRFNSRKWLPNVRPGTKRKARTTRKNKRHIRRQHHQK